MSRELIVLVKLEWKNKALEMAPPFGILYLASALEQKGFEVKLYHENGSEKNIEFILKEITNDKPLFVGFSILTGPSLMPSMIASKAIKERMQTLVVWGGIHPTMLPRETLSNDFVDLVVIGEGEETVSELASTLACSKMKGCTLRNIKGIGYKDAGEIKLNTVRPFLKDLDKYSPAWHHVDVEKYLFDEKYFFSEMGSRLPGNRIAVMITSRGCPSRCAYCYNQFVNKRSFRAHSAERVIEDIRDFKRRYDISAVVFEDDNFFSNPQRALDIVQKINIPWGASIRANYTTLWGEKFIKTLRESNCVELRIGAESGSQRILDVMQKDITISDIYRSAELCLKYDIKPLFNFMVGIPGESWCDVLQTFDVMDDLEKMGKNVVVNGPPVYLPWPGTPLFDLAVESGFRPPQRMQDWAVNLGSMQPLPPYASRKLKFVNYYRTLAVRKNVTLLRFPVFAKILKQIARARWKKRCFIFPLDYYVPNFFFRILKRLGLRRITEALYT